MNQETALHLLKGGYNVLLTGDAGTGKTYTLNAYIEYLNEHNIPVAITASTGIAATHIGGTTIHSWSGMGIKNALSYNELKKIKQRDTTKERIQKAKVLIIDEISMLHSKQLEMLNAILKFVREDTSSFGGIQMVFCGDFFQLPPIDKTGESSGERFAFMAKSWVESNPLICYLSTQYRQAENALYTLLKAIRKDTLDFEHIDWLRTLEKTTPSDQPTHIYTHNKDVDALNNSELIALPGEIRNFHGTKRGDKSMLKGFIKQLLVPETLQLKIGAKVMFLKNNHDKGIFNGTLGTVKEFVEDENYTLYPVVQCNNGETHLVKEEEWSILNEYGKPIVSFFQIPLKLAWAITVHKSQGITLDEAEMDLSYCFEKGQGYVALSRLRSAERLLLKGFNPKALQIDPLVRKADRRFQELSAEAEIFSDSIDKEKSAEAFRIKSKGLFGNS